MKAYVPIIKAFVARIKPYLFGVIVLLMVWGVWKISEQFMESLRTANYLYLGAGALIAIIYLVLNGSVWGLICRIVGGHPPRIGSALLWIECESMRWLPGGIWGYASRVVEAKRIGINKANGGITLAIELFLTICSWGLLALVGVLCSPRLRDVAQIYLERLSITPAVIITLAVLGLLFVTLLLYLNPRNIRVRIITISTDARKSFLQKWPIFARALVEYFLLNFCYSIGFYFCVLAIHVDPMPSVMETAGAYGLAWIIGFCAIGAPGGMGVRAGFLYLAFEPLGIGTPVAIAAIIWRALQIIIELILLVIIKVGRLAP